VHTQSVKNPFGRLSDHLGFSLLELRGSTWPPGSAPSTPLCYKGPNPKRMSYFPRSSLPPLRKVDKRVHSPTENERVWDAYLPFLAFSPGSLYLSWPAILYEYYNNPANPGAWSLPGLKGRRNRVRGAIFFNLTSRESRQAVLAKITRVAKGRRLEHKRKLSS
jgi:hypothetical protein